jgi:TP901 family phage tail tape measure protein
VSDLQVSLALLLENQAEIARELERAGGQAGADFGKGLSAQAQKAFNDLVSQAEKAAKEAGVRFNRVKLQFETVSGDVIPQKTLDQIGKVNKGFAEAKQAVDAFKSATTAATRESAAGMNLLEAAVTGVAVSLTSRLTDAAGTALGSVKGLVQGFLELDGELRLAAAAAGETGGYQRLSQIVDQVGIDAAGTTKQVAELATSLVRAGFSISEVEGALAGAVRGAEATGTGFEAFGNIVGNTLRGFGLEVDQTARVVDVLTNTANSSNASIEGLGYTFEYTAPIAKALGVSLEDVAAAAGLMANAGIQGSVAGTGLRTGLQKLQQAAGGASPEVLGLVRGQERLQQVMGKLGATVTDASGKLLPLEQVFLRLKAGMEKLNQADQVQLANILFGDDAGSKFLSITNQSSSAITKMFTDLRNSKGATDTARTAMAGMGLEIQQLTGTMDSLRNNIGGVMAAGLRPLVQAANLAVGAISGLPKPVKDTGAALIALGIASTGAAISITALNLVLAQTGGLAGLAIAARAASVAVAGIGGSLAIVAAAAVGIALLTGRFSEMDATTKTLVQTTIALGAGVLVFRGIAAAAGIAATGLGILNIQLGRTAVLTALASGAAKGGWLAGLVGAAAAAATVYGVLNNNIKTTGEETEALSSKARELKDQIAQLQKEIADGKKLGIDTTDAQRRVNELYMKLREIERPLELKLSVEKAKSEVKTLKDELGKLSEGDSGRPGLQAKVDGAERYLKLLQQIDRAQAVTDASPIAQQGAKDLAELEKRVNQLLAKKITLPVSAPEQKDIDKELDIYQRQIDLRKVGIRVAIDREEAVRQLSKLQGDIAVALSKGIDPVKLRSQLLPLQIQVRNLDLERDKINKDLAATLDRQVAADGKRVLTAKEQLEVAKGKLTVEQARANLADKIAGQDTARLRAVQQAADAYVNLANAQAALTQSGFDVERSRNSNRLNLAERELQFLRERGASAGAVQEAEGRIAAIKRDSEGIEYRSMQASIQATAQRFEMERKVLELKQAGQLLEQQGAIRAADRAVLQERQQLLELRGKLADPSTTPLQKSSLNEQVKLQGELIKAAQSLAGIERERMTNLGMIFGLERQTQQAQQGAAANQQRAAAASKGWEESLGGALAAVDKAATGVDRLKQVFAGTIQAGNGPVEQIFAAASGLPEPLRNATDATKQLGAGFAEANAQALVLLQTVSKLAAAPSARWAGGGVDPGGRYQVNELGTESFLSRSGALSLIHAPAYGSWSPPSAGMVLPAGLTARLDAMGAFSGGAPAPVLAGIAPAMGGGGGGQQAAALRRLQRSIDALESTMRSYSPAVTVNLPNNAGLLSTLQGIR